MEHEYLLDAIEIAKKLHPGFMCLSVYDRDVSDKIYSIEYWNKGIKEFTGISLKHALMAAGWDGEEREEIEEQYTLRCISKEYRTFERTEILKGISWADIPNITDWVLMRLQRSEEELKKLLEDSNGR